MRFFNIVYSAATLTLASSRCAPLVGKAQASRVEGREFESQLSQNNDLENLYLSLRSVALSIIRRGEGLVSTVSEVCLCGVRVWVL